MGKGVAGWSGLFPATPSPQPPPALSAELPELWTELTDSCAAARGAVVSRCDGLLPCGVGAQSQPSFFPGGV